MILLCVGPLRAWLKGTLLGFPGEAASPTPLTQPSIKSKLCLCRHCPSKSWEGKSPCLVTARGLLGESSSARPPRSSKRQWQEEEEPKS